MKKTKYPVIFNYQIHNNFEKIKLLILQGADVNELDSKDSKDFSLLMIYVFLNEKKSLLFYYHKEIST